jgi:2'-5' RNA ligase
VLVIFSKLAISVKDRAWIDGIRHAHDPQYDIVDPHFTYAFPFTGIPIDAVLSHARAVAASTPRLAFRLSRAAAVKDRLGSGSHVFLLPTDGAEQMRALHDRLYSGVLASRLHPTIPFLPHVTVGWFQQHDEAERVAAALGPVDMRGRLDAIHVAEFDGRVVTELETLSLTPPSDH